MEGTNFLHTSTWQPLERFNITHPFFALNKETIIYTWLALIILLILILIARLILKNRSDITTYLMVTFVRSFMDLTKQTLGRFSSNHFYFITALFCFLVLCNCLALLPWTEEPSKDINTTLAMGIISFLYIQFYAIKARGLWHYIKEYFSPFFLMFPLHVIGKLSSIISLSFRLFGNIFGGSVISNIWLAAIKGSIVFETIGLLSGINIMMILFFILFEGVLQAFVFAMLSLTYLAIAIAGEEPAVGDLP